MRRERVSQADALAQENIEKHITIKRPCDLMDKTRPPKEEIVGSSPTSGILKNSAIIIASKTRPSSACGKKRCVALCRAPLFDMVLVCLVCASGFALLADDAPVFTYSLWGPARCVLCVVCAFCLRVAALLQVFCVAGLAIFADDAPICIYFLWGSGP